MQVMTVNRGLENPVIRNRHRDVLLTAAEQLATPSASRLVRAHQAFNHADYDNTPAFDAVVEELAQAEDAFLALHGGAEVRL